jgi:hypothetical protein
MPVACESADRGVILPGQRSLHMNSAQHARRRTIIDTMGIDS